MRVQKFRGVSAQAAPPPVDGMRPLVHALLLIGFVALAGVMLWPLPLHLSNHVLKAIYHWDAYTNTMLMTARVQGLLGAGPGLYESYFFAPIPDSIVFNENLFGLSLVYAPCYLITQHPLLAYNLTLLASLALSQYFTCLLVRRISGSTLAGILSGFAFALSPYATFELGRIQLVATQWIPLCLLFMLRAFEGGRRRDIAGMCVSYVLQVGTCLYYAVFLLPLLALTAVALAVQRRPGARFWRYLLVASTLAGTLVAGMVYPYFTSRGHFDLQRTESFAADFDGKLAFFGHVHDTNRSLLSLHHRTDAPGAHEEIAFPGFTILGLCLLGLIVPLVERVRDAGPRPAVHYGLGLAAAWGAAAAASAAAHSMLVGAAVLVAAAVAGARFGIPSPYPFSQRLSLWLLVLSVAMFLGFEPYEIGGQPVRGLYYYFHTYVPGVDGIRKVSRQACMTTFAFCVLAGFGAHRLLSAVPRSVLRGGAAAALLAVLVYEFRTFPHPIDPLWAGDDVPGAYGWLARAPGRGPVAVTPTEFGTTRFAGQRGLALHNYLALYHGRRTINGKSSFVPPITHLAHLALRALPHKNATRILHMLGTEYLLVHGDDYPARHAGHLLRSLDARTTDYQRVFTSTSGDVVVYRLKRPSDPSLALLPTPQQPEHTRPLSGAQLKAVDGTPRFRLALATDGNPETGWTTWRPMRPGDAFELMPDRPRRVAMIELRNHAQITDFPLAYRVHAIDPSGSTRVVAERHDIQLFSDQVFRPKDFVFRIPLPDRPLVERLRIEVLEKVPGRFFTVDEAVLWVNQSQPAPAPEGPETAAVVKPAGGPHAPPNPSAERLGPHPAGPAGLTPTLAERASVAAPGLARSHPGPTLEGATEAAPIRKTGHPRDVLHRNPG